jgi:hypothetical protein
MKVGAYSLVQKRSNDGAGQSAKSLTLQLNGRQT